MRLGKSYSVGGRVHYHTGRPYPVQLPAGSVEYYRLPGFWQLDLRAEKRILFDRATLDVYLDLSNATFSRQVTGLEPPVGLAPPREVGFRIVLPSIGLHAEW